MKLLLAEDDPLIRRLLERCLAAEYEVVPAEDGEQAWAILSREDHPRLALMDWCMPGPDGLELCRRIRSRPETASMYVLLLTAKTGTPNVVLGFEAGADDYIPKPFEVAEVRARLRVGQRLIELQDSLAKRLRELEEQMAHVKLLRGLLPICSYCKRVRTDQDYWEQLEAYLTEHSEAVFSHGICPECYEKHWKPELNANNGGRNMNAVTQPSVQSESTHAASPFRIFVAEDDPLFGRVVSSWLNKWGYDFEMVRDGAEAWDRLQRPEAPKMALLDWIMPAMDGLELCRRLRARPNAPYVYLVLLTARGAKDDVLAGLRAGADDYILKPFDPEELQARLRSGQRIIELQEELCRTHALLRQQATHDSLTGLLNRSAILAVLLQETERHKREGAELGILMCDVDYFKAINDSFGHLVGDEVLREMARRMTRVLRTYDTLGRYGGEEFLVVLPRCSGDQLRRAGERLRTCVSDLPVNAAGKGIRVTISIGGVTCKIQPDHQRGGCEDILTHSLAAADDALYRAKDAGRNCVLLT